MAGDDRRKFNIYLTPEGEKVYSIALDAVAKVRIAAYDRLEDEDFDELVRIMDVIYANVNKEIK